MATRRRGSRAGTFLVLVGIAGVLTTTFVAGVWTGRHWPVLVGQPKPAASEPVTARRGGAERPKSLDALPALTFYDELKAPLTAPPPRPKPVKAPPKPLEAVRRDEPVEVPATVPPVPAPAPTAVPATVEPLVPATVAATPASEAAGRFTVQVAAYNARPPADALRATLASAGHDARVVEAVTPGGVRYRVQVGVFATRQAAQDVAGRLAAERALATFVTTR